MLKKYQNFKKIARSEGCSFYQANIQQNNLKVLIKRIKYKCTWNQVLKSKSLKLQSNEDYIPNMIEIFKSKQQYFIVYERPSGICLSFAVERLQKQLRQFYQIFSQFISSLVKLSKKVQNLYVYPEWLLMHRNSIKICHFQPYFQQYQDNQSKLKSSDKHVFMYDITRKFQQSSQSNKAFKQSVKRIRNINFNLGYIAYHFLTGRITFWQIDQEDYDSKIKQIQLNCKTRILNATQDQKLAQLIEKLLKFQDMFHVNYVQTQLFKQFSNFIKLKNHKCCKNKQSFRIVQVSLQKIKLQPNPSKFQLERIQKKFRPCCINQNQEQNPQEQTSPGRQFRIINKLLDSSHQRRMGKLSPQNSQSLSRKKLLSLKKLSNCNNLGSKCPINRQKINSSCILPHLRTQRNLSLNIRNMFRENSKSLRKQNQVKTSKKYLKTEY